LVAEKVEVFGYRGSVAAALVVWFCAAVGGMDEAQRWAEQRETSSRGVHRYTGRAADAMWLETLITDTRVNTNDAFVVMILGSS
jgi:hypothetical protein